MSDRDRYPIGKDAFPVVQMTLRGMGEVVNHAVALHADDLSEAAQAAVKDAIAHFDWRERIGNEMRQAIEQHIKSQIAAFLWSDEGDALIKGTIARAMQAAFGVEEKR